ncbi:MAG: hypothetical protein NC095_01240 [Muribaculum sp.]|nr:hypothetical protein [Muribaculum sp.]
MRKCITLISGCIILGGIGAMSQSPSEEYNQFRQQILSDYANFKSRILEHYDDFLNGEWHEFEALIEESPLTEPKPQTLPEVDVNIEPEEQPMAQLPEPKLSPNSLPGLNAPIPGGDLAEGGPDLSRIGLENVKIDISRLNGLTGPNVFGGFDNSLAMGGPDLSGLGSERMKINPADMGGLSGPKTSGEVGGELAMGGPDLSKIGSEQMKLKGSEMGGLSGPKTKGEIGGGLAMGGPDLSKIGSEQMKINVPNMGGPSIGGGSISPTTAAFIKRELEGKSNYAKSLMRLPDPEFAFGNLPGQIAVPNPGESGIIALDMSGKIADEHKKRMLAGSGYATEETFKQPENDNNFRFDFYGMEAFVPEIKFEISPSVKGPSETGAHWKKMAGQEGGVETARQLFGLAQQLGLNGYLTFRLTEHYLNQRFKNSDNGAKMSAAHFLISNMGYDIRLVEYKGILTVMMPFDQTEVYGLPSGVQENGRKYTILYPEGFDPTKSNSLSYKTCALPLNASGKTSDLRVTGLSLPFKGKSFTLTNGDITLTGEVNENIQKMFYHYPQMPYGDFASSWIDQGLRESLVEQIRQQIGGKKQKDAINSLMALCHNGFQYKTDQEWHIFEKPYFVEENFLYEFNDCEDRAIFMSYLVWNALGIPCQLIQYPGHESVTVAVSEPVKGSYYATDGVKYFSADPTYLGSSIGMVMPAYKTASPTIDKHYK